jgi:hypothetical protein
MFLHVTGAFSEGDLALLPDDLSEERKALGCIPSNFDTRRKLRTYPGRAFRLCYTQVIEFERSILVTNPYFLGARFEVQSNLLGNLLAGVRRREDLDANLRGLSKADSRIDLLTPF